MILKKQEEQMLSNILQSKYFNFFVLINIFSYSLFKESIQLIADISQTIIVIFTLIIIFLEWNFFKKNFLIKMIFLAILAQIFSWISSKYYIPNLATTYPVVKSLTYLFFFFCFSFWLNGSEKKIDLVLFSFSIGVLFTFSYHSSIIYETIKGFNGERIGFNYRNPQHGSLVAGACFIFHFIYISLNKSKISNLNLACHSFMLLVFGLFTIILQSRQSWLAITIALISFFIFSSLENKKLPLKKVVIFSILFSLILVMLYFVPFIQKRILGGFIHDGDLRAMLTLNWNEVKDFSIGVRLKSWLEAAKWIQHHPFFGTGFGSQTYVITTSQTLPDYITKEFRHLHNSNLETLVSWGGLGFLTLYTSWFYIMKKIIRSEYISFYMKAICISFFTYWVIINNFESFFYYRAGQWVFTIFIGCIYSLVLSHEYKTYIEARNENIRH